MSRGIIVFGASGSGTTTIGKELANIMNFKHFDLDDYFWTWDTTIPYTIPRAKAERIELLQHDISECNYFVMSGSICGWHESFLDLLDLAVFVKTPTDIRIERLHNRELKEFGDRILEGGDMHKNHIEFLSWAKTYDIANPPERCLRLHEEWANQLACPVLHINGTEDISVNVDYIIKKFSPKLPNELNKFLNGYLCTKNLIGRSSASVYHYQDQANSYFLKIDRSRELIREHAIMVWLDGKLPVPKVKYFGVKDGLIYLLMNTIDGHMSCICPEDLICEPYENTVKLLAEGILMLQSVDITDCPFKNTLDIKLKDALFNIEHNLVDMDDFENNNSFHTPIELYDYLSNNQPQGDICFCHGDYCLPNIFIDNDQVTGFIDLGRCGIADKWQDIALCVRSLRYNLPDVDRENYIDQFFEHLGIKPDWQKINYYILLDELF